MYAIYADQLGIYIYMAYMECLGIGDSLQSEHR